MKQAKGFTIVELLIVIVVIGILAAITIVAYNGIQNRAYSSAAQSAAAQLSKKIALWQVDNSGQAPTVATFNTLTTGIDSSATYQYTATSGAGYCATVTVRNAAFHITNTTTTPTSGSCTGHGGEAPVTPPSTPQVVITDSFDRANSETTLGSTETGQAWQPLVGTWGITNNTAYVAGANGVGNIAVVETGRANGSSRVDVTLVSSNFFARSVVRASDANNYWSLNVNVLSGSVTSFNISKTVAGSQTIVVSDIPAVQPPFTLRTVTNGESLTFFINDIQVGQVTDSFNSNATLYGIAARGNVSLRPNFNNFRFESQ